MPTNEFEKQVQEQLGEFQLNPSASVWEKVEEEIRGEKKKKDHFLFLIAIGAWAGGYFFLLFFKYRGKNRNSSASYGCGGKEFIIN
ncbi:MAG: hypothetical protein WDO71_13770 [Bacteroidota bacterium]